MTTPIIAPASADPARCAAWMLTHPPHGSYTGRDIGNLIIGHYEPVCHAGGVDLAVAVAQLIHETGNLDSWWAAFGRHNPAGIGVNGRVIEGEHNTPPVGAWAFDNRDPLRPCWRAGVVFHAWTDDTPKPAGHIGPWLVSVPCHVGRLIAYATRPHARTPEQAALVARAMEARQLPSILHGSAPTVEALGGKWATDSSYGARLVAKMKVLRGI